MRDTKINKNRLHYVVLLNANRIDSQIDSYMMREVQGWLEVPRPGEGG